VQNFYKPLAERRPDTQYVMRLKTILGRGILAQTTPQGVGALTCFGTLPQMIFDLRNGVPVITERKIPWKFAIAEIIAFINGARTIDEIESYGCPFWGDYRGKGAELGLEPNDMGPGSYGPSFHDFEMPDGRLLNQFEQVIEQITKYPHMRTHLVMPWKPYYTARGPNRKVIVAPCHGWLHFRVLGERLHMTMNQRSADTPIGVPFNMIQYAALLLMICQVTGYEPGNYVHGFVGDAHIYENQVDKVRELLTRQPRPFPTLHLNPDIKDFFAFRADDFELREYEPHPGMKIPYAP
jgi:thymidylate synthase